MSKSYFVKLDNYWWLLYEDIIGTINFQVGQTYKVTNELGGYHYHTITESDEIKAFDKKWQAWEINREPVKLKANKKGDDPPYGWLDRDGNFYGCGKMGHTQLASDAFGKMDEELEDEYGFVKISSVLTPENRYILSPYFKLSEQQIQWLSDHGFEIDEWDRPY